MCLDIVKRKIKKPTMKERVAYQVLRVRHTQLWYKDKPKLCRFSLYFDIDPIHTNKWEVASYAGTDDRTNILASDNQYYDAGFHCFTTLNMALSFIRPRVREHLEIRAVKVRKVHTYGLQSHRRVLVASERKLLALTPKLRALKRRDYW